jgi:hypothetical protein
MGAPFRGRPAVTCPPWTTRPRPLPVPRSGPAVCPSGLARPRLDNPGGVAAALAERLGGRSVLATGVPRRSGTSTRRYRPLRPVVQAMAPVEHRSSSTA